MQQPRLTLGREMGLFLLLLQPRRAEGRAGRSLLGVSPARSGAAAGAVLGDAALAPGPVAPSGAGCGLRYLRPALDPGSGHSGLRSPPGSGSPPAGSGPRSRSPIPGSRVLPGEPRSALTCLPQGHIFPGRNIGDFSCTI